MSNSSNNKDNNKDSTQQQQQIIQKRQDEISKLAHQDISQLKKDLDKAYEERNKITEEEAVANSRQRSLVHTLEQDVSKYEGQAKKLKIEKSKLEESQKATREKIKQADEKIQNLTLAIQVRKNVDAGGPSHKQIAEMTKKAGEEGQKPFKPMITPDQAVNISGVTESMKEEKGRVPKGPADDDDDEDDPSPKIKGSKK